jgi:hypothetical protein
LTFTIFTLLGGSGSFEKDVLFLGSAYKKTQHDYIMLHPSQNEQDGGFIIAKSM